MCGIDLAQAVQAKVSNIPNRDAALRVFPPPTTATVGNECETTAPTPGGPDSSQASTESSNAGLTDTTAGAAV